MARRNAIEAAFNRLGMEVLRRYKRQVPVDTKALKRSLSYSINRNSSGISLTFGYLFYGIYTDLGTGPYKDVSAYGMSPFELPSFVRSPGKGKMGIRPRYWTSLSGQQDDFEDAIYKTIGLTIDDIVNDVLTKSQIITSQ